MRILRIPVNKKRIRRNGKGGIYGRDVSKRETMGK